jgi:hypothetical protein
MNEAEFIELARQKWAQLQDLKSEASFYEFEGKFDSLVRELNRELLEATLGEVPSNHRKKKLSQ